MNCVGVIFVPGFEAGGIIFVAAVFSELDNMNIPSAAALPKRIKFEL